MKLNLIKFLLKFKNINNHIIIFTFSISFLFLTTGIFVFAKNTIYNQTTESFLFYIFCATSLIITITYFLFKIIKKTVDVFTELEREISEFKQNIHERQENDLIDFMEKSLNFKYYGTNPFILPFFK